MLLFLQTGFILFPQTSASLVPHPRLPRFSSLQAPEKMFPWAASTKVCQCLAMLQGWVWIGKGPPRFQRTRKGKLPSRVRILGPGTEAPARRAHISLMPFSPPPASLAIVNPKVSGSQLPLESVYFSASLAKTTVIF